MTKDELEAKVKELEGTVETLTKENEKSSGIIAAKDEEIKTLKDDAKLSADKIKSLEDDAKDSKEKNDQLAADLQASDENAQELQIKADKYDELKEQFDGHQKEFENYKNEHGQAIEDLNNSIIEKRTETQKFREKLLKIQNTSKAFFKEIEDIAKAE